MAGRLAADVPRRARLRLQVEHGLDARHARRTSSSDPGLPALPPPRADVLAHVRVHRELRAAALARRGRARQGLAARRRCPATAGRSSRTCARSTRTCGRTPARSCCSWAASSAQGQEWNARRLARLAPARAGRARGRAALVRDLNRVYRASPRSGSSTSSPAASAGSRRTTPRTTSSRSRAVGEGERRRSSASATSRRCRATTTASGCPQRGRWREVLNTDSAFYGGSDVGNLGGVEAEPVPWHDQPFSADAHAAAARRRLARPGVAGGAVGWARCRSGDGAVEVPRLGARTRREVVACARPSDARARARRRVLAAGRRAGDDYCFVARRREASPTRARAGSRRACAGRRASLDTARLRVDATPAGRPRARRARHLRAARRHVHAPRGRSTASIPRLPRAARARRHRDRADAGRDLPRRARLGLRRRLHLRRRTRPTAARTGSRGSSTPRTRAGLGVILDVVYNHVGPGSEALTAFGPYFTDRARDVLGRRDRLRAARRARVGAPERRALGARLPRRRAAARRGPRDLRRLAAARLRRARRARARGDPRALVISEMEVGDCRPIERVGPRRAVGRRLPPRAARPAHRRARRLLRATTAPSPRSRDDLARRRATIRAAARRLRAEPRPGRQPRARRPPAAGRAARRRRRRRSSRRCTPLLFMGEEYGEAAPFQFFTDHIDPEIAEATREGRKREFAAFASFSGEEVPDPQAPATFERSKLAPAASRDRALPRAARAAPRAAARARGREADEEAKRAARAARRRRARRRLRTTRRVELSPPMKVWPGTPVPARRDVGRRGDELLALLRERRARRALPLRRRRRETRIELTRAHRVQLALLPAGRRPRPALRLPRPRPVRRRRRATASTRPSC